MSGRERACATLAATALATSQDHPVAVARATVHRARLALFLADLVDLPIGHPATTAPAETPSVHSADLCTRFWTRMVRARCLLMEGSAAGATRLLTTPVDLPVSDTLPVHLQVVVLLERGFLALLSADRVALRQVEDELRALGAAGEADLVEGLRHDTDGSRRAAADSFLRAADGATYAQPAVRELALACRAQLLDALGDPGAALDALCEAATATEARRNAVPFLGWTRQGTPMAGLLPRLDATCGDRPTTWCRELAADGAERADITALLGPVTASAREQALAAPGVAAPALSPREREVLLELARGATYADIAARLYVSENTVKTHVSSLYGKLAASRRSEALAVARRLHLI
jgi:DNA-binding CsgD family transcriptional regulator